MTPRTEQQLEPHDDHGDCNVGECPHATPAEIVTCSLHFPPQWEEMLRAKLAPWELVRCPSTDDDGEAGFIIGVPRRPGDDKPLSLQHGLPVDVRCSCGGRMVDGSCARGCEERFKARPPQCACGEELAPGQSECAVYPSCMGSGPEDGLQAFTDACPHGYAWGACRHGCPEGRFAPTTNTNPISSQLVDEPQRGTTDEALEELRRTDPERYAEITSEGRLSAAGTLVEYAPGRWSTAESLRHCPPRGQEHPS